MTRPTAAPVAARMRLRPFATVHDGREGGWHMPGPLVLRIIAAAVVAVLLAGGAVAVAAGRRRPGLAGAWRPGPRLLAFAAAAWMAFAVCGLRAGAFLSDALAPALEGRDVRVVGVVAAMPQPTDAGVRLRLAVESAWLVEGRRGKAPARKRPRGEGGRVRTDGQHGA
ncbi:DUF4131 domain-containing protein, partial [Raoultella sp. 18098]|uniref:DUF4131 domain-containing protein n=1 Tax=Raoultella sp. 18098 TaxID=2681430 RepID=UPI001358C415